MEQNYAPPKGSLRFLLLALIVILFIFFWVRNGLMGCSCPRPFEICERDHGDDESSCECLCDGNMFTCEYTCPGCSSGRGWNPITGEPNKLPQAGCCWGEDGWGSDKEREGCSIQYCGQAPCDGQDIRNASMTHWTQQPAFAMEVMWPVILPFALIACVCYVHRRDGEAQAGDGQAPGGAHQGTDGAGGPAEARAT